MATDNSHYFYSPRDDDTRGNVFTKLFIDKALMGMAINQGQSDDIALSSPEAYNFMIAKYYDTKKSDMADNDIHYEFTDFIIETALYHRKVNSVMVQLIGEHVEGLVNSIKDKTSYEFPDEIKFTPDAQNLIKAVTKMVKERVTDDIIKNEGGTSEKFDNLLRQTRQYVFENIRFPYPYTFKTFNSPDKTNKKFFDNLEKLSPTSPLKSLTIKANDRIIVDYKEFMTLLPLYSENKMGKIWYTTYQGDVVTYNKVLNSETFRDIYVSAYEYKAFENIVYDEYVDKISANRFKFNVKCDKIIIDSLRLGKANEICIPNVWNWENISKENCFGSQLSANETQCNDVVRACITGEKGVKQCIDDILQLKDFMPKYPSSKPIHPLTALGLLLALGFVFDPTAGTITDDTLWEKDAISKNIPSAEIDKIKNYLKELSNIVRFNPTIFESKGAKELLSKRSVLPSAKPKQNVPFSAIPPPEFKKESTSNFMSSLFPPKYEEQKLPKYEEVTNVIGVYPTVNDASRIGSLPSVNESTWIGALPTLNLTNSLWNLQGGFASNIIPVQTDGADLAKGYLDQLVAQLKQKGVSVDQTLVQNIDKQINDLKALETKIVRTLEYITKYKDMMNTFGSNGILSQDKLDKVNEYFAKLEQKSNKTNTSIIDSMKSLFKQ